MIDLRKFLCVQSSDFAAKAVDVVANELIAISKPGEGLLHPTICSFFLDNPILLGILLLTCLSLFHAVDQVQLDRAKKSTKSAILMNLESRVCKLFFYLLLIEIYSLLW